MALTGNVQILSGAWVRGPVRSGRAHKSSYIMNTLRCLVFSPPFFFVLVQESMRNSFRLLGGTYVTVKKEIAESKARCLTSYFFVSSDGRSAYLII